MPVDQQPARRREVEGDEHLAEQTPAEARCANDNGDDDFAGELSDPLLDIIARLEVARTRLW